MEPISWRRVPRNPSRSNGRGRQGHLDLIFPARRKPWVKEEDEACALVYGADDVSPISREEGTEEALRGPSSRGSTIFGYCRKQHGWRIL